MERNLRMSLKEWLPFFGVVLMLASCTEDERLPQTEDGYGLKLESVSLYEGGTSTRALLTDVDAVGLYLTKQNQFAEYGSNPRCVYTRAGGGWRAGDNAPKINSANGGRCYSLCFPSVGAYGSPVRYPAIILCRSAWWLQMIFWPLRRRTIC